jgi:hypothetical protein
MLRKILKWLGVVLAAGLVAGAIFIVNLVWFRPFSLNLFYEKVFVTFLLDNPELLTMMGVAEQFGYRRHNAHLNDASVAKQERDFVPSLREYTARWGITPDRLRPGQKVMHPGPMNRGVEIDARVADSEASLVVDQVRSGLVVRMAVLYDLLTHGPAGVQAAALHEIGAA